jgi:hypothetical protein
MPRRSIDTRPTGAELCDPYPGADAKERRASLARGLQVVRAEHGEAPPDDPDPRTLGVEASRRRRTVLRRSSRPFDAGQVCARSREVWREEAIPGSVGQ